MALPPGALGYDRVSGTERVRVVLNLTHDPLAIDLPGRWVVAVGTDAGHDGVTLVGHLALGADEGLVLRPG